MTGTDPHFSRHNDCDTHFVTITAGESGSPLNDVMEDIRYELARRVAATDRDANRDTYDALEHE